MEVPGIGRSVTQVGHDAASRGSHLLREGQSSGDGQTTARDPVGAHVTDLDRCHVLRASLPAAVAIAATGDLGQRPVGPGSLGQEVSVPAVRADDEVFGVEVNRDAHGNGLLADT